MNFKDVAEKVRSGLPDARIIPSGEACSLHLTVVSAQFEGLNTLRRQQRVLATLQSDLATGHLHAVTLKTFTDQEWASMALSSDILMDSTLGE